MHISQFSDYSLRILIFLAASDEVASARSIAKSYGISFHHVAKAAQFLRREGYVAATRGRAGGMWLAKPAEEISVGAVIRKSEEGNVALVECMKPAGKRCAIVPVCRLASALRKAQQAFFSTLDDISLADVTSNKPALRSLLSAA